MGSNTFLNRIFKFYILQFLICFGVFFAWHPYPKTDCATYLILFSVRDPKQKLATTIIINNTMTHFSITIIMAGLNIKMGSNSIWFEFKLLFVCLLIKNQKCKQTNKQTTLIDNGVKAYWNLLVFHQEFFYVLLRLQKDFESSVCVLATMYIFSNYLYLVSFIIT